MTKEDLLQVEEIKVEVPLSEESFTSVQKEIKNSIESNGNIAFAKEMYAEMLADDPKAVCPSCGGRPKGKKVCDVCGAGKYAKKIDYFRLENEGILQRLYIPEFFTRETYSKNILLAEKEHLKDNGAFQMYLDKVDRLIGAIGRGTKLESSLFISAPSGFGKEHMVYTLMCIALDRGLTVFPYIDLAEAEALMTSFEEGNDKDPIRESITFTDLELYESDVCILKVPHANNSHSFKTALKVIDRRARRNKSTIIISRYHIRYFAMLDSFKEIEGIINPNSSRPKNLKVIEFTK